MDYPFGKTIDKLILDGTELNGGELCVHVNHPYKFDGAWLTKEPDTDVVGYSFFASGSWRTFGTLDRALVGYLVLKYQGVNSGALEAGVCRALEMPQ